MKSTDKGRHSNQRIVAIVGSRTGGTGCSGLPGFAGGSSFPSRARFSLFAGGPSFPVRAIVTRRSSRSRFTGGPGCPRRPRRSDGSVRFNTNIERLLDFNVVENGIEVEIDAMLDLDAAKRAIFTGRLLGRPHQGNGSIVIMPHRIVRGVVLRIASTERETQDCAAKEIGFLVHNTFTGIGGVIGCMDRSTWRDSALLESKERDLNGASDGPQQTCAKLSNPNRANRLISNNDGFQPKPNGQKRTAWSYLHGQPSIAILSATCDRPSLRLALR
jgi:hypothetical protein